MNAYVVDRNGLMENIRILQEKAAGTPIYGVIKGNGYGLGLVSMAEALSQAGIQRFAVTELWEIRTLREAGFETQEILMMRATCIPEELRLLELEPLQRQGLHRMRRGHGADCGCGGKKLPVPCKDRYRHGPVWVPA